MKRMTGIAVILLITWCVFSALKQKSLPKKAPKILFTNVTLIDGNGQAPLTHADLLIENRKIAQIGRHLSSEGALVINGNGKTIMPALTCVHMHIGLIQGTTGSAKNYTRENILQQLLRYQDYGVAQLLSLGTDRQMLFQSGLRDSSRNGLLPGARLHSAGYGFGVPGGAPPKELGTDQVFRPRSVDQVKIEMDSLALLDSEMVKLWVDDFGSGYTKMDPVIYLAIIKEAHRHHLRVAAHVYYLSDARRLVRAGVDIIAHSIRDSIVDDQLASLMVARKVVYIPTLCVDEFACAYAESPQWLQDPFFKASLGKGVYEMITSAPYQDQQRKEPVYSRKRKAFETAMKNVKKLYDAGVFIALGTDSGAMPVRTQGFSEHLELALMVQAGLTPLQAITIATKNASEVLRINQHTGTLEKGKAADFLMLKGDPSTDISKTMSIIAVYKAGEKVSDGPLSH